ncbi:tetratricopeptide repeat protein [Metallibacterium sp.]|uniref:tetratricopeptide repeat protein n=2 Tax=Metallibacterium sp. TaxID=2940281 RepID=UPI002636473B|nr:tetratricopeptide repeat protein [Metallibacterium sp.]
MRAAGWIVALALTVSFASVANARAQSLPACLDFAQPPTPALQQAAARGDIAAQTRLGTIDASGLAVPRDVARALPLLTAAAEQGDARAQYQLGKLYEHDVDLFTALKALPLNRFIVLPLMPDDRIAWHWYRQAARQGYVPAMWALSALETNAALMPTNPLLGHSWQWAAQVHQRALHWLVGAANAGFAPAQVQLVEYADGIPIFRLGLLLPHTPPGTVRFAGESRRFDAAVSQGFGLFDLATRNLFVIPGIPVQSDVERANWMRLWAAMPVAHAAHGLDALNPRRQGIPVNPRRALGYLEGLAIAGDRAAVTDLGFFDLRDPALARALFARAARRGDAVAEWRLGMMLKPQIAPPWPPPRPPLERKVPSAAAWQPTLALWTQAAEQGDALAALSLARQLMKPRDAATQTRAYAWLLVAAARWPPYSGFREYVLQRELVHLVPRLDAAQRAAGLAFAAHWLERVGCVPPSARQQASAAGMARAVPAPALR